MEAVARRAARHAGSTPRKYWVRSSFTICSKRAVERRAQSGHENAAAGSRREGGQGVLAADVAAGVVFDGDDRSGIDDDIGALRGFESGVKVLASWWCRRRR